MKYPFRSFFTIYYYRNIKKKISIVSVCDKSYKNGYFVTTFYRENFTQSAVSASGEFRQ